MTWATPNDATADLRDFLDLQYGVGRWLFRETPHGGSDCLAAMHAALDAVRARYSYGTVKVVGGGGMFRFSGPIATEKLKGMIIAGDHPNNARMVFDCTQGAVFEFTGAGGYTNGGLKNLKVFLEDGYKKSSVYPLILRGSSAFQPDDMLIENVYFAALGNSYWYAGPLIYGDARSSPQGVRVLNIRNLQMFQAHAYGGFFSNMVQSVVDNFGIYAGVDNGNTCYILGNTTGCDFRRFAVSGDLVLSNCKRVHLIGSAGRIFADASADYCSGWVEAPLFGVFGSHSDVRPL